MRPVGAFGVFPSKTNHKQTDKTGETMKQLTCEICGSTELRKQDGVFVCQSCGCQYDAQEVKKLMVEGTVTIDKSKDLQRFLDLAKSAKTAANMEKAEDYASRVLEIDQRNYEAWYIQGCAVDWQTSIANDRRAEAGECFAKVLTILGEKPIEALTNDDIKLLEDLKNHLRDITLSRCDLYSKPFQTRPSDENRSLIVDSLDRAIALDLQTLETLGSLSDLLTKRAEEFEDPDGLNFKINDIKFMHANATDDAGEIAYRGALKINGSACQSASNWNSYWEKEHVFDYFGTGDHDKSQESEAFNNCGTAYKNIEIVLEFSRKLVEKNKASAEKYVRSSNFLIRAVHRDNPDLENLLLKSADELICQIYDNEISIVETDMNHRTNRRYHNQFSNGDINDDGYTYKDDYKSDLLKEINRLKSERRQFDPVAKAEAEKKKLAARYWNEHPTENDLKKAGNKQKGIIEAEIEELRQAKSKLGLLKRRERKEIDEQIEAKQEKLAEIESTNSKLKKECESWVEEHYFG